MMTSSRKAESVYVWAWLPKSEEPVPAGVLERSENVLFFRYGTSYLSREGAIPLYQPELPLREGWLRPRGGLDVAGVVLDAAPNSWGRRVIETRLRNQGQAVGEPTIETYLLESGSDRAGGLDFQQQPDVYVPRTSKATLDELLEAAQILDEGRPISAELEAALLGGSSLGGARPKAALRDQGRHLIAKFPSQSDRFAIVKAEAAAMMLAARVGLNAAHTELVQSLGREVLLVERFDRIAGSDERKMVVSALTILELAEHEARYASYPDIADNIRKNFYQPTEALRELFARIVFNVCVGNTDDHARNHAALWDGSQLSLAPAYDICPYPRVGGEAAQALAIDRDGRSLSQLSLCVEAAHIYGLTEIEARGVIDSQIEVIETHWKDVADRSRLTNTERDALWGRAVLNPYIRENY
jgi:serine/threonine-protein kinase HipA